MGSEIKPRLWNCFLIGPSCTKYKRWIIKNTYPLVTQYIIFLAGACQPRPPISAPCLLASQGFSRQRQEWQIDVRKASSCGKSIILYTPLTFHILLPFFCNIWYNIYKCNINIIPVGNLVFAVSGWEDLRKTWYCKKLPHSLFLFKPGARMSITDFVQ